MAIKTIKDGEHRIRVRAWDPVKRDWGEKTEKFLGSKKGAKQREDELKKLHARKKEDVVLTIWDALERHLQKLEDRDRGASHRRKSARLADEIGAALGSKPISDLEPEDIQGFYNWLRKPKPHGLGLAARTIQHYHRVLSPALTSAVHKGWIRRNVSESDEVNRPQVRKPQKTPPTAKEVELFLHAAFHELPRQTFVLLCLAAKLSARRGELVAVRKDAIERNVLWFKRAAEEVSGEGIRINDYLKEEDWKYVTLMPSEISLLEAHLKWMEENAKNYDMELVENPFLFSFDPSGSYPMAPNTVSHSFLRIRRKLNLKRFTLHDFRHFGLSDMMNAGIPVGIVSQRAGHKLFSTTMDMYGHKQPEKDILAAQYMDQLIKLPGVDPALPPGSD